MTKENYNNFDSPSWDLNFCIQSILLHVHGTLSFGRTFCYKYIYLERVSIRRLVTYYVPRTLDFYLGTLYILQFLIISSTEIQRRFHASFQMLFGFSCPTSRCLQC